MFVCCVDQGQHQITSTLEEKINFCVSHSLLHLKSKNIVTFETRFSPSMMNMQPLMYCCSFSSVRGIKNHRQIQNVGMYKNQQIKTKLFRVKQWPQPLERDQKELCTSSDCRVKAQKCHTIYNSQVVRGHILWRQLAYKLKIRKNINLERVIKEACDAEQLHACKLESLPLTSTCAILNGSKFEKNQTLAFNPGRCLSLAQTAFSTCKEKNI